MLDPKTKYLACAGLVLVGIGVAAALDWAGYMRTGYLILFQFRAYLFPFIMMFVTAGVIVLLAAYHRHEVAMKGTAPPRVIEREKTNTIVIVKIKCRHCGMLVDATASACPNCAATM